MDLFDPDAAVPVQATYLREDKPTFVLDLHGRRDTVVRVIEWVRAQVPGHVLNAMLQIEDQIDLHELRARRPTSSSCSTLRSCSPSARGRRHVRS